MEVGTDGCTWSGHESNRQTDKQTDRQIKRQMDRQIDRQMDRHMDDGRMDGWAYVKTDGWTDRQTDRWTDGQINGQIDVSYTSFHVTTHQCVCRHLIHVTVLTMVSMTMVKSVLLLGLTRVT